MAVTPSTDLPAAAADLPDDLEAAIARVKRERNAVILAHYYQESEIQDLADFVGDSLQLAQAAQKVESRRDRLLRRPLHGRDREDPESRAHGRGPRPEGRLLARRRLPAPTSSAPSSRRTPGAAVLSYVNCSAEVKAMSDLICTSANAVKMAESLQGPAADLRARQAPRALGRAAGGAPRSDRLARHLHRARAVQREAARAAASCCTRRPRCWRIPSATRRCSRRPTSSRRPPASSSAPSSRRRRR